MGPSSLGPRLFSAGLYGLMAQWHLAPGSFSWQAAAAALADGRAPAPEPVTDGTTHPDGGDPR